MNLQERAFLRAIGDRIRARRNELKLTQQKLSEKCWLHRTFIGPVERSEWDIPLFNLRQIAKALRTSVSVKLDGTG